MRSLVGLLLVWACAAGSARDLRRWQSNAALWTAAAGVADTPRVAVNLAVVALTQGDLETALRWDADALAQGGPQSDLVQRLVRQHLQWLIVTGHGDVCSRPAWRSWCAN